MKLLFLCHAHPDLQAGGTEIFAQSLFRALRNGGAEGVFVAGTASHQRPPSPGTALQAAGGAADELLVWTAGFDSFHLSQTDLHGVVPELVHLLREVQPDVVHIHHVLQLGMEVVGLVRRVLPRARIVMTLHDFYPICAHDGQMTTTDGRLCHTASHDACRRCLPERSATDFRLRALQVERAFAVVDRFVSPSRFLRDRYIAWGLDAGRIVVLPNGLASVAPAPHRDVAEGPAEGRSGGRRDRFAFFGHINRFKGATVALEASSRLSRARVAHALVLHGGTAFQNPEVLERFASSLAAAPDARHCGPYRHADQSRLIAGADWVVVPSIWWENAPLVIGEAFAHRRPVICADVGGMAEMVADGVCGLHAPVGDAAGFAAAMRRGIEEPGLWERLVAGIVAPPGVAQAAALHLALYRALLGGGDAARAAGNGAAGEEAGDGSVTGGATGRGLGREARPGRQRFGRVAA